MAPPFTGNRPPLAAAGAAPAAPPVRGLPADAPKLVISGAVYSPTPAPRMLIVNGQVFREGADLGSGVVLEQVQKESAVLGFRGGRYNVFF
jgi:general secretion pathway protein B